ncbi:helix-turn-helix transcriptional regulator [Tumebacillus sp. DT12]|uniref:Helix-turn-helix transcriptional regulator n=1 Tax=Tumebacillus lacus TaxID=2995335 RepID=A0ABT3X5J6_9BACL|nr:helix-turn-helix domain-containing protein [Tumebacillus lacus]MCX7572173.1 helix-turn-helix transcriptional regulator [Tumebacillus lacus]
MKYFELRGTHSKVMLTQFAPRESDPAMHAHGDEYQISIPLVGVPSIELPGQVGTIDWKRRVVTGPGEEHRHFANEEASRVLLINLQRAFVERVLAERMELAPGDLRGGVEFARWGDGSSDGFRKLADLLTRTAMTGDLDRLEQEQAEWQLAALLLDAQDGTHRGRWRESGTAARHPAVRIAQELLWDQYAQEWSLDRLADEVGLSKYHLLRLFREQAGQTPAHYLTERRVTAAAERLAATRDDVTQIAFDTGFGSLSTFERAFKRKYGVTAQQYRKGL